MAYSVNHGYLVVTALGVASFVFGIIAENEKPAAGVPLIGKDFVLCKYPKDPTVALGYLSALFLIASTAAGFFFLYYPYQGKSIPKSKLFQSTSFVAFFSITLIYAGLGLAFLLWPTITEQLYAAKNIHHDLNTTCPTATSGLLGGGAFSSLSSSFLWLAALMLADNARGDYFDEAEKDNTEILINIGNKA